MNEIIRVAHFFGKMDRGGAETFIMNVYRKIDRDKIQFDFIVTSDEKGAYDDEIRQLGGNIYILPSPSNGLFNYIKRLYELIKLKKFDVVHSHVHYFSGINLLIAKKTGVNIRISHSHTAAEFKSNSLLRKIYKALMRFMIIENSTALFTCSDKASENLYGRFAKKAIFIPNGIDFDIFKETSLDLKKELNINNDSILVGHVGNFKEVKNHKFIIELFHEIIKVHDNVHLILVGDGELKENMQMIVKGKKIDRNVHFLGVRNDVSDILQNLKLFIFPSINEGLPVSLIEVQAANIKAIVSGSITRQLLFTDNLIEYINLDDFDKWINEAIKIIESNSLQNRDRQFNNNIFNIENVANQLTYYYLTNINFTNN